MVSINTNLSSLRVQANLTNSTNGLNKAIERLSTGYKINHSSDNAANYSIANSYEAKLSSYDMAASNVSMGMDLLAVAQDTISSMQDHGSRLHALITQARNGTYGTQSLQALTQEAGALISEIQRMYSNAEYNKVSLFDNLPLPEWAKTTKSEINATAGEDAGIEEGAIVGLSKDLIPKANGFIADIATVTPDIVVSEASELADAIAGNTKIGIENGGVLAQLAILVNSGTNCSGKTIILTDDIDLSDYQTGTGWTAIGNSSNQFKGTFDGQGHSITGLVINKPSVDYQGLFGYAGSGSTIKNVAVKDCNVKGKGSSGGVVGYSAGTINNSYSTGVVNSAGGNSGGLAGYAIRIGNSYSISSVTGHGNCTGGLVGTTAASGYVDKSFAKCEVNNNSINTGGLVGYAGTGSKITDSYAESTVEGTGTVGGLVGALYTNASVKNSYAKSEVEGTSGSVGGLVGNAGSNTSVSNSYATGYVTGTSNTGGLVGQANTSSTVTNCYATSAVSGTSSTGGLVGQANTSSSVTNCYATGAVSGTSTTGGLVGDEYGSVTNCYATGDVTGTGSTGGLVGRTNTSSTVTNSYATGAVTSKYYTGGLVGYACDSTINNCYTSCEIVGEWHVGGLCGGLFATNINVSINNCYSKSNVRGNKDVGGFIGEVVGDLKDISISNSYSNGNILGKSCVGGFAGVIAEYDGKIALTRCISDCNIAENASIAGKFAGGLKGGCTIDSCLARSRDNYNAIGSGTVIDYDGYEIDPTFDISPYADRITTAKKSDTTLQVGIHDDESSQITFDTGFEFDLSEILKDIKSDKAYATINKFISTLSDKATEMGSVSNRLESSLDSILVNMENVTSSLSTIKDADMATESSQYIKMQILQQASATLLATANQSPSIALQLI